MPARATTADRSGAAAKLPSTCEIRNWVVFGPGYWKGQLYSKEMCERVPRNFTLLRNYYPPVVKIGHDKEQLLTKRLEKSLGFPSLGEISSVTSAGQGRFAV